MASLRVQFCIYICFRVLICRMMIVCVHRHITHLVSHDVINNESCRAAYTKSAVYEHHRITGTRLFYKEN